MESPTFIIAELSGNHHGKYEEAVALVEAAAQAGADAVKSQTYTADTITLKSNKQWFRTHGQDQPDEWRGRTLYDLYQEASTPWEWLPKLKQLAEKLGMIFFTSVFDESAVKFNENMGVQLYKIAAYETVHIPLLEKVAGTGKPVIMSIGFDNDEEAGFAVRTLQSAGTGDVVALHCVTTYAEKPDLRNSHLATINDIERRFGVISGFSDNTGGITIPVIAATCARAKVIEKHLILDRKTGGTDARFSIEPHEFAEMVRLIRAFERGDKKVTTSLASSEEIIAMIGNPHYGPSSPQEVENTFFRPSIWVAKNIAGGEFFTSNNIRIARPNCGLNPKHFKEIIGQKARCNIEEATPLTKDLIALI